MWAKARVVDSSFIHYLKVVAIDFYLIKYKLLDSILLI